jgi:hypothetical protein
MSSPCHLLRRGASADAEPLSAGNLATVVADTIPH